MESAWPMLLFLAALICGGIAILVCGIQTHEAERRRAEGDTATPGPRGIRSFFATFDTVFAGVDPLAERLLREAEQHMRQQTEVVARFVESPSIDRLHDLGTEPDQPELPLLARIRKFLESERQLVTRFVADPSVDRLHASGFESPEAELPLFGRIQNYLESERQLVTQFVADPSLDRLHIRQPAV